VLVTDIREGAAASSHGSSEESVFSGRQRALFQALGKKDPQLASMYFGALWVLKNVSNPDGIAQAAHGLREVLEKLPRILDMPIQAKPASMMDKIRPLEKTWSKAKSESSGLKTSPRCDVIDTPLRKFLDEVEEFFSWLTSDRPTRKQQAAIVVRGLDPLKKALPQTIESLHVEEWDSYRNHFELVSHHHIVEELGEFMKWIEGVEGYLIDRLIPRTFDDFTKLDKIIGEAEANG
jgi:hypothetical protein